MTIWKILHLSILPRKTVGSEMKAKGVAEQPFGKTVSTVSVGVNHAVTAVPAEARKRAGAMPAA